MNWFSYLSTIVVSAAGIGCLVIAACFVWDRAFTAFITQVKVKVYFCEYVWHRKQFRNWLMTRNCGVEEPHP